MGSGSGRLGPRTRPLALWIVPVLAAFILFGNHYSRDVTGALQTQLEEDIPMSSFTFGVLNSIYYFPNTITPLLMGILQDTFRPIDVLLGAAVLSSIGQMGFGVGCQYRSLPLILSGRGITGLFYEAIDMGNIPITVVLFRDRYSLISGFTNGFLRLGSVANFLLSPYLYRHHGLPSAIWVSCLCGMSSVVLVLGMKFSLIRLGYESPERLIRKRSDGMPIHRRLITKIRNVCRLPKEFWIFAGVGMSAYTVLIPFFNVGSAIFQRRYSLDPQESDGLLSLPEAITAVISPLVGMFVDTWTQGQRTVRMGISVSCFVPIFAALAISTDPRAPYICMVLFGLAWSFFNSIFWGLISTFCTSPSQVGISIGILGCALNIGPTLALLVFGVIQSAMNRRNGDVLVLWLMAVLSLIAVAASIALRVLSTLRSRRLEAMDGDLMDINSRLAQTLGSVLSDPSVASRSDSGRSALELTDFGDDRKDYDTFEL